MEDLEKRIENIEDTLTRLFNAFAIHDAEADPHLYDAINEIRKDFEAEKFSIKYGE